MGVGNYWCGDSQPVRCPACLCPTFRGPRPSCPVARLLSLHRPPTECVGFCRELPGLPLTNSSALLCLVCVSPHLSLTLGLTWSSILSQVLSHWTSGALQDTERLPRSTQQTPVAPPFSCDKHKCLQTLPRPLLGGRNGLRRREQQCGRVGRPRLCRSRGSRQRVSQTPSSVMSTGISRQETPSSPASGARRLMSLEGHSILSPEGSLPS